jgi:acyl-coenzyme A thioesterase PaaI-like protein
MTSIEFKVNFLAPGLEGRGPIDARADVLKSGRSIALVKAVATQAGKAVAEGLFTYVFRRHAGD